MFSLLETIYMHRGYKYPIIVFRYDEYRVHRSSPNKTSWHCKHKSRGCKARLITSGKTVKVQHVYHSHEPQYTRHQLKEKNFTEQVVNVECTGDVLEQDMYCTN